MIIVKIPVTTMKIMPGNKKSRGIDIGMSLTWAEFISFWANWTLIGALIVGVVVKDGSGSDIDQAANFLVDSLNAVGIASARLPWGADWDKFPGMLNGPVFSADKAAPIRIVIGTKPQQ
jgi:hypothetical protein